MNGLHGTTTLVKLHMKETFLNSSFYIAATVTTILGYLPVRAFINSIDSQGFNPSLSPFFTKISSTLGSLFSSVMVDTLFAEGPHLFALYCAFIPMLLYICSSSIITYHSQRDAGTIELIRFGPINSKIYLVSLFLKDLLSVVFFMAYIVIVFFMVARVNNLLLGPAFLESIIVLLVMSVLICAYARLFASATFLSAGSLSLFFIVMIVFAFVHIGSYMAIHEHIRTVSTVISWIIRWISPFYYASLTQTGFEIGSFWMSAGGLFAILIVSGIIGSISIWLEVHKETRV